LTRKTKRNRVHSYLADLAADRNFGEGQDRDFGEAQRSNPLKWTPPRASHHGNHCGESPIR